MKRIILTTILVGTTTAASAQPTKETPNAKNPRTATTLAIVGSLAGPAIIATGVALDNAGSYEGHGLFLGGAATMLAAPMAGHWYSGKALTWGLPARAAGMFLMGAAVLPAVADTGEDVNTGLLVGGAASVVAGTIYDIATAGDAAREWNRDHGLTITIAPTISNQSSGLALVGSF